MLLQVIEHTQVQHNIHSSSTQISCFTASYVLLDSAIRDVISDDLLENVDVWVVVALEVGVTAVRPHDVFLDDTLHRAPELLPFSLSHLFSDWTKTIQVENEIAVFSNAEANLNEEDIDRSLKAKIFKSIKKGFKETKKVITTRND